MKFSSYIYYLSNYDIQNNNCRRLMNVEKKKEGRIADWIPYKNGLIVGYALKY